MKSVLVIVAAMAGLLASGHAEAKNVHCKNKCVAQRAELEFGPGTTIYGSMRFTRADGKTSFVIENGGAGGVTFYGATTIH